MREILEATQEALSVGRLRIDRLTNAVDLPDSSVKLALRDDAGRPRGVALWSSSAAPEGIRQAVENLRSFKAKLSERHAAVVLEPIVEGEIEGRSYAVYPFCTPVAGSRGRRWLERKQLRGPVMEWLRGVAKETAQPADGARVAKALEWMAEEPMVSAMGRQWAAAAREAMERGDWQPMHVAMHNDLWLGNILFDDAGATGRSHLQRSQRFVIIDWGAARVDGYPLYDLMRVSDSLGMRNKRVRREMNKRCDLFDCDDEGLRHHLCAALAHLGVNRDRFPLDRYAQTADTCLNRLEACFAH